MATIDFSRVETLPDNNARGPAICDWQPEVARPEKWLLENPAADGIVGAKVERLPSVARYPSAHLVQRGRAVSLGKRFPGK